MTTTGPDAYDVDKHVGLIAHLTAGLRRAISARDWAEVDARSYRLEKAVDAARRELT